MIKKKVVTCSIVFAAIILTKLYSGLPTTGHQPSGDDRAASLRAAPGREGVAGTNPAREDPYWSRVTFADEQVPLQDSAVKRKLKTYLHRFSYQKMQSYQMHRKADQYLPRISAILASYGIPEDFKYIPVVESGLDPRTSSHKGAGGYWQFIPATARLYGLKINGKVDERMNLHKSTHAAARYLQALYQEFGDWTLVAAAYNVGGGSLRKSIRRQGKDSYYELQLNRETGAYVYKLISAKSVIEHPHRFGYRRLASAETVSSPQEPELL